MKTKINKTKARNLYNQGKTIYLTPCKCNPDINDMWVQWAEINNSNDDNYTSFDSRLNSFEYYNCCSELGKYTHFYIESEVK